MFRQQIARFTNSVKDRVRPRAAFEVLAHFVDGVNPELLADALMHAAASIGLPPREAAEPARPAEAELKPGRAGAGDPAARYSPAGWRSTKPSNSPPPRVQRVPPSSAWATVSKRQPAIVIQTWPSVAQMSTHLPGPGSPQSMN